MEGQTCRFAGSSGCRKDNLVLYVSLDNIWFSEHKLYDLASNFVKRGGRYLYLDEVHKYPNWAQELKNIYDDFAELQIVFTGSSMLEILNARADLSRRAVVYEMQGFSFREYRCFFAVTVALFSSIDDVFNWMFSSSVVEAIGSICLS